MGLCVGFEGGPRGVAVSCERGTPVQPFYTRWRTPVVNEYLSTCARLGSEVPL